jgi:adenosylcobinamide-phosphate synthase
MSFLVLLGALLLAHYRPLPPFMEIGRWHLPLAQAVERNFNDGRALHGVIAWGLVVLLPAVVVAVACLALHHWARALAYLAHLLVLYLALDMRGFSAPAEVIASALRDGNIQEARDRLAIWSRQPTEAYGMQEISRLAIETTLVRAHHGLFAPVFWFVLLGPAGAVLYRLSHSVYTTWGDQDTPFHQVARRFFDLLDWLPARFTAIGFAVVGDFEDALYCWRTQATAWKKEAEGILLASGAGALGVRLGEPLPRGGILEPRPELGLGDPADADYLVGAVGLIWRVLVLMLILLLLMTFAHWLGR